MACQGHPGSKAKVSLHVTAHVSPHMLSRITAGSLAWQHGGGQQTTLLEA